MKKQVRMNRRRVHFDTLRFNVPVAIRLLEYAKEDARDDIALHRMIENAILLNKKEQVLEMKDYKDIIHQV